MIAEGDLVVTRFEGGRHTYRCLAGSQPTGSDIQLHGINVDRIEAGLIAEHWGEADTVGMLYQMGVDPFVAEDGEHLRPSTPRQCPLWISSVGVATPSRAAP